MFSPDLALIVPCYDEAARLHPQAFLDFVGTHPSVWLLMVDDGSADETGRILDSLQKAAPSSIGVMPMPSHQGKAEAVRLGILEGIRREAHMVGFWDADLSTPLTAVDDFLALAQKRTGLEVILGSRVMLMGRDIRRKAWRHYLGRVFATAASLTLDLPVYDTQCGAKVFRVNDATAAVFAKPFRSRWIFDVEILARYLEQPVKIGDPARRSRIYELAVPLWHDSAGVQAPLAGLRSRDVRPRGYLARTAARLAMFLVQHTAMATVFEIRCASPDERLARQAASAAFDVVDRLEQELSRFIENSDISRINHLPAGESTIVGYDTMQCLQLASLIHAETGGAFDVAIGTGFDNLVLYPGESVVLARADNVRLDLGAIGKGYAVDRVADALEEWEIDQVLIDAGLSSVLALEPPAGQESWPLTLSEPGDTGVVLAYVGARQRALGASGIQKRDHILNPRDHTPVRTRTAAWVSAPRHVLADISRQAGVDGSPTAVADALSTAFMINEVEDIAAYCRRYPGLEVWILEDALRHFSAAPGATPG